MSIYESLTKVLDFFTDLAVIFRPGIISHPDHELEPKEHQLSQSVLEFLIEHQDWFMLDVPPPPPNYAGRGAGANNLPERQDSYGSTDGEVAGKEDLTAGRSLPGQTVSKIANANGYEHSKTAPQRRHTSEQDRMRGRPQSPGNEGEREVLPDRDLVVHTLPHNEGGWRLVERTRTRSRERDRNRDHEHERDRERRRHTRRPSGASALSDDGGALSGLESGEVSPLSTSGVGFARNGGHRDRHHHVYPRENREGQYRSRTHADGGAVTVTRSRTLPTNSMRRAAAKERQAVTAVVSPTGELEKKGSSPLVSPLSTRPPPNVLKKQKRASMQPPPRSTTNILA